MARASPGGASAAAVVHSIALAPGQAAGNRAGGWLGCFLGTVVWPTVRGRHRPQPIDDLTTKVTTYETDNGGRHWTTVEETRALTVGTS